MTLSAFTDAFRASAIRDYFGRAPAPALAVLAAPPTLPPVVPLLTPQPPSEGPAMNPLTLLSILSSLAPLAVAVEQAIPQQGTGAQKAAVVLSTVAQMIPAGEDAAPVLGVAKTFLSSIVASFNAWNVFKHGATAVAAAPPAVAAALAQAAGGSVTATGILVP